MSPSTTDRSALVAQLRAEFDDSFAQPVEATRPSYDDLLLVRAGDHRCAVPVTDISSVVAKRAITPIPDAPPVVCGVVGVRSLVAVVYDLAILLGGTRCERRSIVLAAPAPDVGFAFDELAGHFRIDRDDAPETAVTADGEQWPTVRIASLLDQIRREMDVRSSTGSDA